MAERVVHTCCWAPMFHLYVVTCNIFVLYYIVIIITIILLPRTIILFVAESLTYLLISVVGLL